MLNTAKLAQVERSLQKHAKCLDDIEARIQVIEDGDAEGALGDFKEDMDDQE